MRVSFRLYVLLTIFVFPVIGCQSKSTNTEKPVNDTTLALSQLLNKDFLSRNLPGYGALKKKNEAIDTIIFQADSLISNYLPESLNGFHFKQLTRDQICEEAVRHYSDSTYDPSFFQLRHFQKQDSAFDIELEVSCVMPRLDEHGKRLSTHYSYIINDCSFGVLCGGGMSVTVYKQKNLWKIKKDSNWSD
jgi:hypothetical protein